MTAYKMMIVHNHLFLYSGFSCHFVLLAIVIFRYFVIFKTISVQVIRFAALHSAQLVVT